MTGPIVAGVDGSAPATAAVEWAAADAGRRGLALRLVHVCEHWARDMGATQYCEGALEAAADRARALAPGLEVSTEMLSGRVTEELVAQSATAESMVVGSRGLGGFRGMILGSASLTLAGHAAGPVVVVREHAAERLGEIVVGYDGSPFSDAAVEYAIQQARARGVQLRVLYAWYLPPLSPYASGYVASDEGFKEAAREAAERVAPFRERNPDVRLVDEQVCDHPVAALMKCAATADLVVVGSRGHGGLASAVLGSVSHGVLHHVTRPVAVVRPRPAKG
ncbi:universal stress protein [Nonomuraea rhodomycinica]|uniref:Universal stress protein n=2 Tax=Nonomuraea rhodomycinica TaxID=1712872 RepID=A0A7Y6IJV8_9ACTN|nr:universal stress protein [Nonomuraea rhodomycinica]